MRKPSSIGRRYGWRKSLADKSRNYKFAANFGVLANLPPLVDLRPQDSPIVDQGQLGSCTANAIGAALAFDQGKQGGAIVQPSRLQLYYDERAMEGNINEDAGAEIKDGIQCAVKIGVAPETLWPYNISRFAEKPPSQVYAAAEKNQALVYSEVSQNLCQMKGCLAQGYPIVIGFSVYESFESDAVASTGVVPMPDTDNESLLGGHAVMVVGYDDASRRFMVRNSWGTGWGDPQHPGYFTMPYDYLLNANLSSDFWTVFSVELPA